MSSAFAEQVRDVCVCHVGDRSSAYGGLSAMLLARPESLRDAASRVLLATSGCRSFDYLDEEQIREAGLHAIEALAARNGAASYAEERAWLFGEGEFDPFLNSMSPAESTYLASDCESLRRTLESTYSMAGYKVPKCELFEPCLGHMGVELDFMRHCLEQVAWGEDRYATLARGFFGDHLRDWGVLFAVVLRDKARHPALLYLSYALDKFIACESAVFRHSMPGLCVQRSLTE
jgi:TorA maturation chaperone TorD